MIQTGRLRLRTFKLADAPALARLAGDRAIADTMISIPHPYTLAMARSWIRAQADERAAGRAIHWAIARRTSLAGAISLRDFDWEHSQVELSLWIGRRHWGKGYASEAVVAVVQFAFASLGINRIYAHHMSRNPASGKVLGRAGFRREGLLRQRVIKWGRFEDVVLLARLRCEWLKNHS
jgi:RimJ/RimL family protein N-acetyltransferase